MRSDTNTFTGVNSNTNNWAFSGTTQSGGTFDVQLSNYTQTVPSDSRPLGNQPCTPGIVFCEWTLAGTYGSTWTGAVLNAAASDTSFILFNGATYSFQPGSPYTVQFSTTISGVGSVQTTGSCPFGPLCTWNFPNGGPGNFSILLTISQGATVLVSETLTGVANYSLASSFSNFSGVQSGITWTFENQAQGIPEPGTCAFFATAAATASILRRRKS